MVMSQQGHILLEIIVLLWLITTYAAAIGTAVTATEFGFADSDTFCGLTAFMLSATLH